MDDKFESFRNYLEENGYSDAGIKSRIHYLKEINNKNGNLDEIVSDDDKVKEELKQLSKNDHHGNKQNALRLFYKFRNGKSFPKSKGSHINENLIQKVLENLKIDYPCFVSEAQLRDAFAIELARTENVQVFPEYSVKNDWTILPEKEIHFDLVAVDENGERTLFEFKYKTKKFEYDTDFMHVSLSNQNDYTHGRYDIWKDIYRIQEAKKNKDLNIASGYVIFISNNKTYRAKPSNKSVSKNFSLADGKHKRGKLDWNGSSAANERKKRPSLKIDKKYEFKYDKYNNLNTSGSSDSEREFDQLIVEV